MRKKTEGTIQKAIIQLLEWHPKVIWVTRMNAGNIGGVVYASEIKKHLLKPPALALRAIGGVTRKAFAIRLGPKDTADIIGMLHGGRMFAIEVKKPEGRVSKGQREWLERMEEHGALVGVCRSVEEVETLLQED